MSQANSTSSNNGDYPKEFSTLDVLQSFLKAIKTIQTILTTSNRQQEAPYLEINSILSNVEGELTQAIKTFPSELPQEAQHSDRDIPYLNSFRHKIDLAIKRVTLNGNP
jgi:hypothetical protein